MVSLSMILLTVPIFFPMMAALDFGLPAEEFTLWFRILVLIVVEVGLITTPVWHEPVRDQLNGVRCPDVRNISWGYSLRDKRPCSSWNSGLVFVFVARSGKAVVLKPIEQELPSC